MTTILKIDGYDEIHGAPADWNPDANGPCLGLPTKRIEADGIVYRVSQHAFTVGERLAIANGASLYLWVSSPAHPVVAFGVEGVDYTNGDNG